MAPTLDGIVASMDCLSFAADEVCDHYIAIGEANEGNVESPEAPLAFLQRRYGSVLPAPTWVEAATARGPTASCRAPT